MREGPDISRLGSLIGDPARANMLTALMGGKALTASELAGEAGVTQQTASSHLSKLEDGGLIACRRQGRHKYFGLADESVARGLEVLMGMAAGAGHLRTRTGPRNAELLEARVCYNHLAGSMGTRLFDHMVRSAFIELGQQGLVLTPAGRRFAIGFGIDLMGLEQKRSPLCRECLDWSERRSHLAGSLGRAVLARIEDLGWARRDRSSRVVRFTEEGRKSFARLTSSP